MENCIEFQGCKNKDGYGVKVVYGKNFLAHRISYCKAKNLDIKDIDGFLVMHTCDNPACVNPSHLILGTTRDNIDDKVKKNRQAKGDDIGTSKLTSDEVLEIRKLVKFKSQRKVAKIFGVSQMQVSNIVRRKQWAHLPEQQSIDE